MCPFSPSQVLCVDISTELDIAVSGAKVCRPGVMPHPLACLSVCVPRPAVSIVLLCLLENM